MKRVWFATVIIAAAGLVLFGCTQSVDPKNSMAGDISTMEQDIASLQSAAKPIVNTGPPSGLVTASFGDQSVEFWPFTGTGFPGEAKDPVNILFFGQADPRDIRAALLSLDGDRTAFGFPDEPPFNSTWDDAIGDEQSCYSTADGWTGSAIQLACGYYQVARFHIRLFKMGDQTAGAAHFEVLIPGTEQHEVISWEVAEQFVVVDFMRSGLLDGDVPMSQTGQINPSPWRTIRYQVYNGLPVELRMLIGGPVENVTEDVPIGTDGMATILNLASAAERVYETRTQDLLITYDQTVPKPFCGGENDYVYVAGPITFHQTTTLMADGTFERQSRATGELSVTPIDMTTGQPGGETLTAQVRDTHGAWMNDTYESTSSMLYQKILPASADGAGRLFIMFGVNSDGHNFNYVTQRCAEEGF